MNRSLLAIVLGGALAGAALTTRTADAQTIDTRGSGMGAIYGGGGIFGQSFRAGSRFTRLDDFSFWIGGFGFSGGGWSIYEPSLFRAYVYAFDGSSVTGSALFVSAVQSAVGPVSPSSRSTFSTDGVRLTPNARYLALVQSELPGLGLQMGLATDNVRFLDTYPQGQIHGGIRAANGDPAEASYYDVTVAPSNDLMFVAHFSTVTPEPMSRVLLATGLAGVAAARRRKKKES